MTEENQNQVLFNLQYLEGLTPENYLDKLPSNFPTILSRDAANPLVIVGGGVTKEGNPKKKVKKTPTTQFYFLGCTRFAFASIAYFLPLIYEPKRVQFSIHSLLLPRSVVPFNNNYISSTSNPQSLPFSLSIGLQT